MAKYKGKTARIDMPADQFAGKFDDLTAWGAQLENMPDDVKQQVGDISFQPDAIVLKNPSVGQMTFNVTERRPDKVVFRGEGMIPIGIEVDIKGVEENTQTDVTTIIDVEIPMMLRTLIGGKLQQLADVFGDMIGKLAAGKPIV